VAQRYNALDQTRGAAVVLIHFVDVFYLLWDGASGFDWFGAHILDKFPIYGIPPILFAFSTGVSLTFWRDRHPELKYLFQRCGLLLLSGLILSYYVDGSADTWGLFEMIALLNVIIFFVNSIPLSAIGLTAVLALNAVKPPFYSFTFPTVPYFLPNFEALPRIISQSLVSGLFPLIPFLAWGFWGVIIGRIRHNERHHIASGMLPLGLGLALRTIQPITYSQWGNAYSTSMMLTSLGACSLGLLLLTKITIAPLTRFGRYAWRITFWRYPILYMPLVWLRTYKTLPHTTATIISLTAAGAQIGLTYIHKRGPRESPRAP